MAKNSKKGKKVIVAMSSGVDSSVAAALLKKQGYDVIGVFMHFWKEPGRSELVENKCCSLEAQEDARKVCQTLGIPLYTANIAKEFKKEVVDYFLNELKYGRTPNPCVACNKHIKFNVLFKKMLEMKADYISSGHYAQIKRSKGKYGLFQGADKDKDQSYFLFNFNQKQLSKIIFPIGKYKKPKIREIAKKYKLPVFDKDDSQGICFAPEKYPTEFIKRNLKMEEGDIFDVEKKKIGRHKGLALYTIGQRRGVNIGGTGPYYVVDKDIENNILVVTNKKNQVDLYRKEMEISEINWIKKTPKFPFKCKIKIRYRKPAIYAIIKKGKTRYSVEFKEKQKAITPGQSAVFYSSKGEVIGGGTILK